MGSALGVRKAAADRLGLTVDDYNLFVEAGFKWCGGCRAFHNRDAFGADKSRSDGLAARCAKSRVVAVGRPGARERRIKAADGLSWCRACRTWLPSALVKQGACRFHLNEASRALYAARRRNQGDKTEDLSSSVLAGGRDE
ncbi:hypothetical protein JNW90_01075 [Micromonospora sp. STR1s_5]|nr:hypothetical protein [Micromonospora sp. STR1s_5]